MIAHSIMKRASEFSALVVNGSVANSTLFTENSFTSHQASTSTIN